MRQISTSPIGVNQAAFVAFQRDSLSAASPKRRCRHRNETGLLAADFYNAHCDSSYSSTEAAVLRKWNFDWTGRSLVLDNFDGARESRMLP